MKLVLGWTWKYQTLNLSKPLKNEPWTYQTSNLLNLLKTEPNLEPYLIGWQKMGDFFEVFPSKPNLEPTEPLVCPQKPNLEPTEPPKTEPNLEPNQVRPNTNEVCYLCRKL